MGVESERERGAMSPTGGQRWGVWEVTEKHSKRASAVSSTVPAQCQDSASADREPSGHCLDTSKDRELTTSPSCPLFHFQPAHIGRTHPPGALEGPTLYEGKDPSPLPGSSSHPIRTGLLPKFPSTIPPTEGSTWSQLRWGSHRAGGGGWLQEQSLQ